MPILPIGGFIDSGPVLSSVPGSYSGTFRGSIGNLVSTIAVFPTDEPFGPVIPPALRGTYYFFFHQYTPIAAPPLPPNQPPPQPYLVAQVTASTPVNTPIPLTFVGLNSQNNYLNFGHTIKFINSGAPNNWFSIQVEVIYFIVEDWNSDNPAPLNNRRLLYSSTAETVPLAQNTVSIFTSSNRVRKMSLRMNLLTDLTVWYASEVSTVLTDSRWYNREFSTTPATTMNSPTFQLFVGSQPVSKLYKHQLTTVRFNLNSSVPITRSLVLMIRTDSLNQGGHFLDSYEATVAELNTQPPATPLMTFYGLPALIGPSTPISFTSPPAAQGEFCVDPNFLDAAGKYRFIIIPHFDATSVETESFSFISPEYEVSEALAPCFPGLDGGLIDYYAGHSNVVNNASGYERFRSVMIWKADVFDACRAANGFPSHKLQDNAVRVRVWIYKEGPGGIYHVLDESVATKVSPTKIKGPNFEVNWQHPGQWVGEYDFRIRWEPFQTNIFDYDPVSDTISPATSNQSWIGKTIYIRWELELAFNSPPQYRERYVATQQLKVEVPNNCYSVQMTDEDGNIITKLCSGIGNVTVRVESCINPAPAPTDRLMWGLIEESYTLQQFREYESWVGNFDQLQQAPFVIGDFTWQPGNVATAIINTNQLTPLKDWRLIFIQKKQPIPPPSGCQDCSFYVNTPPWDEYLQTLADCYLFNFQTTHLQ